MNNNNNGDKLVFLYAGQGAQKVGMGKDLYEAFPKYKEVLDEIEDKCALDFDIKKVMWEGPEETLMDTKFTQPCMAAFAVGVTETLREKGIEGDAACGLSLGEYGALYQAGVWDALTYVDLVAFRGKTMAFYAEGMDCAMSAVLGLPSEKVEEACEAASDLGLCTIANYNYPMQYVVCGDAKAVEKAEILSKELGAKRIVKLAVGGPFHTKVLEPAGKALGDYFHGISWNEPRIPVAMNVTGEFLEGAHKLQDYLILQVSNSVRMEQELQLLLNAGYRNFVEIGPGKVLSGFLKKTAKVLDVEVTSYKIETAEELAEFIEASSEWRK